jgi:hypothetical protein
MARAYYSVQEEKKSQFILTRRERKKMWTADYSIKGIKNWPNPIRSSSPRTHPHTTLIF